MADSVAEYGCEDDESVILNLFTNELLLYYVTPSHKFTVSTNLYRRVVGSKKMFRPDGRHVMGFTGGLQATHPLFRRYCSDEARKCGKLWYLRRQCDYI